MVSLHFVSSEKIDKHPIPVIVKTEAHNDEAWVIIVGQDGKENFAIRLRDDGVIQLTRMDKKDGRPGASDFLPIDDEGRLYVSLSKDGASYSLTQLIHDHEELLDPSPEAFYTQEVVDKLVASARVQGHTEMRRESVNNLREEADKYKSVFSAMDRDIFLYAANQIESIEIASVPEDDEPPQVENEYRRGLDDGRAEMQNNTIVAVKNIRIAYPDGFDRGTLTKAMECIESLWSRPEDKS